jgi:hypothetical protein
MKVTLSIPRSRPAHLTSFAAPAGCESPLLRLDGDLGSLLAERDPTLPIYHVMLPALSAGKPAVFEATELASAGPAPGIACVDRSGALAIDLAGSPFMTFHHTTDYPKPVINPILTPGGVNMLREPMAAWSEGEHPWQRGLTLMQGAINGVDCWNERPDKAGFGRTAQDKITVSHNPMSLLIASENTWYEADRPLMTDSRSYRLFDSGREAVVIDIALTLKASHGPVTIGDTKEGGFLCIRVNPTMDARANGHMRNAYGATDEKGCWSLPSHWLDYYGPVGDEVAGYAVFDHPQNLRYPTTWHVRGYGLLAPNCWMFKPDHPLAASETLTFRWRVIVHAGDTDQADIANRFLDYVDGARVEKEKG